MKTLTLNDELTAINEAARKARLLANITRRAETLFTDGGYRLNAENAADGLYFVHSPKGDCYLVWHGAEVGFSCKCPCFAEHGTCKHLEAVDLMKQEQAEADAADEAWERSEEAQAYGYSRCPY